MAELGDRRKGDGLLYGVPDVRGGFVLLQGGGELIPVREEPVVDARPHPGGWTLLRTLDGSVVLRGADGEERRLADRGYVGTWSLDGRRLTFVELTPRPGATDASRVRVHDVAEGRSWTVARGSDDTAAALSPSGEHVIFVSGRTGVAALWIVSSKGGDPVQLTNHGERIGPDFVPMPSFDLIWDESSDRIFYEAHYDEPEVYVLRVSADRSSVVEQGRVAAGAGLRYVDGLLEYTVSGDRTMVRHVAPERTSPIPATLDFGGTEIAHTGFYGPVGGGGGGSLGATAGWVRNPLKSTYAPLYGGFKGSHEGHDFMAPRWTQVYAAADGVLIKAVDGHPDLGGGNYGNYVRMELNGLQYEYAHLQAATVFGLKVYVATGMPIGRVGASGAAKNAVPHLHFQMRESKSIWNFLEKLKLDPPVDPTPFYAKDILATLPGTLFHPRLSYGSCGLLSLPQPDYRFPSTLDIDPPQISEIQIFARSTLNLSTWVRVRCRIQDPSGVFDGMNWPSTNAPLSRGAHLTAWCPEVMAPDKVVRLDLISGSAQDGIYESKDFIPPTQCFPKNGGFTFVLSADDRANEGFSFANIGNTATSEFIYVDGLPGLTNFWSEVETIDLGISLLSAPEMLIVGQSNQVDVRVTNHSPFVYAGGEGLVAMNPTRDFGSTWHWPGQGQTQETFAIPSLGPGASIDLTVDFDLPMLATMPHFLFALARGQNDPVIHNSSDFTSVEVVPMNPDLVVSSLSAPAGIGLGQSFNIQATIENVGLLPAVGTAQLGAWISLDGDPFNGNGDDVPMGGACVNLALVPGASIPVSFQTLNLPANVLPSLQSLVVCVDTPGGVCGGLPPNSNIWEMNELNNCYSQPIAISLPDLIVSQVNAPGTFGLSSSYSITTDVTNTGNVAALGLVQLGAWLSIDGDPFNGNGDDIPLGGACVNVNLVPGATQSFGFQSLMVPNNATIGAQQFVVCVDTTGGACGGQPPHSNLIEVNEFNNCLSQPVVVAAPDAELVSISYPDPWLGNSAVPVTVTVRNNGPDPVDIPVNVSIGPNTAPTYWFANVAPGASATAVVPDVYAPPANPDCGGLDTWSVTACTNLTLDFDPTNDCKTGTIGVQELYADLEFKITQDPGSSANQGELIDWEVTVKNVGNKKSVGAYFITGLDCNSGKKYWQCNLHPKWSFPVPPLDPGKKKVYAIDNYKVMCNASTTLSWWIKAEFDYTAIANDSCENNNLDTHKLNVKYKYPCW
jgi:murein DD-endopeptidase MepM/ murein hydrolase activator NlpD